MWEVDRITSQKRRSVDLAYSAYDRLRIPRDGDQRSELMSIPIPKRVRVLDGVADPLGGSVESLLSARNGINQIAEIWNNNNLLPESDIARNRGTLIRKGCR